MQIDGFYISGRLVKNGLMLSEFKHINQLLFPQKSSKKQGFSHDFLGG